MDEITAKLDIVKLELAELQSTIRAYDGILLQIKGWCITVSVAIIGFSITGDHLALLALAALVVTAFFLADAYYKAIQRAFIGRGRRLQEALSSGILQALQDPHFVIFEISGASLWNRDISRWGRTLREARHPNVFVLYLLIAIVILAAWALMALVG